MADGTLILVAGALLVLGIAASLVAGRLRVPGLVLFLGVGMLLGSDVLGLIDFGGSREDVELARTIGVVALALILFEGGLAAGFKEIRPVLGTSVSLAIVGTLVPSTGRISLKPAARPPSNRISASATTPIVRASSTSSREPPKSIRPRTSDPSSMPTPRNSTRPGTRRRPATSDAATPRTSRPPATRIRVPSAIPRRVYGRGLAHNGFAMATLTATSLSPTEQRTLDRLVASCLL